MAASAPMQGTGAIAPRIVLNFVDNLDFGELSLSGPADYTLDSATGLASGTNAVQTASFQRGSFTISGRNNIDIELVITSAPFVCDVTFVSPCTGTPVLSNLTNTFTATTIGQMSGAACTGILCTDVIYLGGRLDFATGVEDGRWTSTITVTAMYQ